MKESANKENSSPIK